MKTKAVSVETKTEIKIKADITITVPRCTKLNRKTVKTLLNRGEEAINRLAGMLIDSPRAYLKAEFKGRPKICVL